MSDTGETDAEADPEIEKRYQDARAIFLSGDKLRAIELLSELAAEGIPQALHYLDVSGGKPDVEAATRCYLDAAASGFAPAYWGLGSMYFHGMGVQKSAHKAADYYLQGVKLGDVYCSCYLGELLASGHLGEVRHDLALPLYWSAARQGSAVAQRRLGVYYSEGMEVEMDLKLASELYEAAAEQGDKYAANNLAIMYERGNSAVAPDLGKAIRWYEVAAGKGIATAMHNLAACHAHPDSPGRDLQVAALWFHKAAEHGLRLSMESLARIYTFGEGVERVPDKAEYWKRRAAAAVDPNYPTT